MPVDVDALVISNTKLSAEYNVVALEAPEIAARSQPGQFVMVKPARDADPLLRRPFSVFEVLRDPNGTPTGVSLLNKQVGISTRLIYGLEPGHRMPCLGPLGRAFAPLDVPACAWMVAGGVGLAPFATLADVLRTGDVAVTLFYGARHAADLFYLDHFERRGVHLLLATEDGSRGEHGLITAPLERALRRADPTSPAMLFALRSHRHVARGGETGVGPSPSAGGLPRASHGMRPRRVLQLRCTCPRRPRHWPLRASVSRWTGVPSGTDCVGRTRLQGLYPHLTT